jgi:RNA polymerase sigma-70 factor (ECF subfamily)
MSLDPHVFFEEVILGSQSSTDDYRRLMELLWESYSQSIFLFAYAKLGNRESARDVCQDTFVQAIQWITKNAGQIPVKVNFPAWLRRITRNLIIDRFRRPALVRELPVEPYGSKDHPNSYTDCPEMSICDPIDHMAKEEQIDALRECLEELSEQRRRVVILVDIKGLSYDGVAKEVSMPTSTVGVTLHRTRKELRDCVEIKLAR